MSSSGLIAGCMPATPTTVNSTCSTDSVIRYSTPSRDPAKPETADNKYDTVETIQEIDAHNNVLRGLCPDLIRETP